MTAIFLGIILLSLALAGWSKRGHLRQKAEDFFVASGQFNALLFFFLAVGETYSIGSILGYPGGVYAGGGKLLSGHGNEWRGADRRRLRGRRCRSSQRPHLRPVCHQLSQNDGGSTHAARQNPRR